MTQSWTRDKRHSILLRSETYCNHPIIQFFYEINKIGDDWEHNYCQFGANTSSEEGGKFKSKLGHVYVCLRNGKMRLQMQET